jgi:hypothetical protein
LKCSNAWEKRALIGLLTSFSYSIYLIVEKKLHTYFIKGLLMMRLNVGLKSTLLALAVAVALPVSSAQGQEKAETNAITVFLGQNKGTASVAAAVLFAAWVDMKTNSNKAMFETTLAEDCEKLVASFSLVDTAFYKNAVTLLRKVIIGRPVKFVQKDIPQEDGSTIKGKKTLSQEPYGALGLFDAYVLSQVKDFSETIPTLATLYILVYHTDLAWISGHKKATGEK